MFTIECLPHINEAIIYRFESEAEAVSAAKELARKHRVQVNVMKVIKRFLFNFD